MADFKELTLCECVERILKIQSPLVLMHVRPDGDTVGSAAGLMEIFRQLGRDARYASSDKVPARLEFLLEGEIMAKESEYSSLCPVSIDVPSPMQLGAIGDKLGKIELMIDHHEVAMPFADIYTVRGMSSAAEVLYLIAEELISRGLIKMTKRLAYAIYAGISSDTGGFLFSNTSPDTHRRAAHLMECGIDAAEINHRLFYTKSCEQLRAEGFVLSRIERSANGKIAYSYISCADRNALGIDFEYFETAIDMVRSMAGAEIAFVIKETDSGAFKGSIRSTGADVTLVARNFSGGGHVRAAGCTVEANDCREAAEILLSAIIDAYF